MDRKFISPEQFLEYLNNSFNFTHTAYEKAFWLSNMGDHGADKRMNTAQAKRDAFRADKDLKNTVDFFLAGKKLKKPTKEKLEIWKRFFNMYQMPPQALSLKEKAGQLEAALQKKRATREEGYLDPKSGKFVKASENKMRDIIRTHSDEALRKACFEAMEKLPLDTMDQYIEIIKIRNEFARAVGYEDFYAYKIDTDEGMTKKELFSIFEKIYQKTKYAFADIRKLEKNMPGLRKPWNFSYMMTGDFTREEDPYFQFDQALSYWGKSFAALGVDFQGGSITLDLLDRKGKYNNGFCHWPIVVHYKKDATGKNSMRIPGSSNFTCNAIPRQVGSGFQGIHTLFHEGGHAAHLLNSTQTESCLNHEYPPQSVSWAETQSMFMDSISSSIEWKNRYAKSADGKPYPFDIYERKLRKVHPNIPLDLMYIMFVIFFEKEIYECKNLNRDSVLKAARKVWKKYLDLSGDSLRVLNIPHIYSWESSAYYHGYGLAELGVEQWREYFYKKYGYIVDNPAVGREMQKVWKYAALYPSKKFVKLATGSPLRPDAFIKAVTQSVDSMLAKARTKIARLEKVPRVSRPVRLNAKITMVHGKKKIADNAKSFEDMDAKYRKWLDTL